MTYRVGVDVGGTFTDFCAFDERTNALHTLKVPSTPDRPGDEVMQGIAALRERFGVAGVVQRLKGNLSAPAERAIMDEAAGWDAAITGVGD